ncbi:Na/Pi-cotransporter II-like protein, partial [gut metagenome]
FTRLLAWLAERTIPGKVGEEMDLTMPVLDERLIKSPAVALQQAKAAVEKMSSRAYTNFTKVGSLFTRYDEEVVMNVSHREELLDKMEVKIGDYLIKISDKEINDAENRAISEMLKFIGEYERIGDYTIDLMECAQQLHESEISFSGKAQEQADLCQGSGSGADTHQHRFLQQRQQGCRPCGTAGRNHRPHVRVAA